MKILAGVFIAPFVIAMTLQAAASDARLADAAMQSNKVLVASLLKQGADVNGAQGDGSTALHWAASHGDLEMVQTLLKAGASVKATTRIGAMTPVFAAAENGHANVIEALLRVGGDAREANANGTTLLMVAAAAGSAEAIKVLVDHGADLNARDNNSGQTALMFAAAYNSASALKVLLERHADPNILTKVANVVETLSTVDLRQQERQAQGQPPNRGDRPRGLTTVGGLSALHFAAREGHMDVTRELVQGGADINLPSGADKTPPITEAIINGHVDLARFLLEHGANPKLANDGGLTPLYATIDVRWRANAWYPQPTIAQEKVDYLDFMKELLDHGADINARLTKRLWFRAFRYSAEWVDPSGATPFWRAAQANDVAAMRFLVAHGANPDIATTHKVSPMMVAAGMGFEYQVTTVVPESRLETIKYLVEELSADVNAKDENDYTTLHAAAYVGDNNVIRYLVARGANVKARAKGHLSGTSAAEEVLPGTGDTVADMANGPREKSLLHPETVKLLESMGSENSHDCRSTACVNNTKPDKPPVKP